MSNVNRIFLIGRLTADPELRYIGENIPLAKFTLAVDRPKRADGASAADFISVIAWRSLAEISGKYLKKGRLAYVGGRIQVRKYQTAEQETRFVTEVLANELKMLDKPSAAADLPGSAPSGTAEPNDFGLGSGENDEPMGESVLVEDDIPF